MENKFATFNHMEDYINEKIFMTKNFSVFISALILCLYSLKGSASVQ